MILTFSKGGNEKFEDNLVGLGQFENVVFRDMAWTYVSLFVNPPNIFLNTNVLQLKKGGDISPKGNRAKSSSSFLIGDISMPIDPGKKVLDQSRPFPKDLFEEMEISSSQWDKMKNIWEASTCSVALSGKDVLPSTIPIVSIGSLDYISSIPISLSTIIFRESPLKGSLDLSNGLGDKTGPSFHDVPSIIVPFPYDSSVSIGRDPYLLQPCPNSLFAGVLGSRNPLDRGPSKARRKCAIQLA